MKNVQSKKILDLQEKLNKEIEKERKKQSDLKLQGFDLLLKLLKDNNSTKNNFLEFMKANTNKKDAKALEFIKSNLNQK